MSTWVPPEARKAGGSPAPRANGFLHWADRLPRGTWLRGMPQALQGLLAPTPQEVFLQRPEQLGSSLQGSGLASQSPFLGLLSRMTPPTLPASH